MDATRAAVVCAFILAFARRSDADDLVTQCVDAHEAGQRLRNAAKLREAKRIFATCARDTCPEMVRVECERFLGEVERELPSVLLNVRDDQGRDVADLRVDVDGIAVADYAAGLPTLIDPGEHVLRVTRGTVSTEQHIVARAGEKSRVLTIVLPAPVAAPAPKAQPDTRAGSFGRYAWFVAAGGSLLGFGGFAIAGLTLENALDRRGCAPGCTDGDIVPIRVMYGVADVSLAIAIVTAGIGLVVNLTHRSSPKSASLLSVEF